MNDGIEVYIKSFKKIIQNWEDTDPNYLNKEIRKLRHYVFYIHSSVSSAIINLLYRKIGKPISLKELETGDPKKLAARINKSARFNRLVAEISFPRLVHIAIDYSIPIKPLEGKLMQINALRNDFAHPLTKDLDKYKDRGKYLKTLKLLTETMKKINKVLAIEIALKSLQPNEENS